MKKEFQLNFCFKGTRTYVQGPDILNAVLDVIRSELNDVRDIKYTAHKLLTTNAVLHMTDNFVQEDFSVINSVIHFESGDSKVYCVVSENSNPIECSTPYSEEEIFYNSRIEGKNIHFLNSVSFSLAEIVVSMNKYYLSTTVEEKGKWIVTKLEFSSINEMEGFEGKEITLSLQSNFKNKLTKSKILVNENEIGFVYFSLI